MARLMLELADRWGQVTALTYEIWTHDLAQRWLALTEQQIIDPREIRTVFHNRVSTDLPQIERELRATLEDIQRLSSEEISVPQTIDQTALNDLHRLFELHSQNREDPQLQDLWHLLNTQIHCWESAAKISPLGAGSFNLLYDINPGSCRGEISPRDLLWLDSDLQWGGLYLGYNTVGKDWLSCYLDDDRELIRAQAVTAQRRFSAETFLCFGTGGSPHRHRLGFEQWHENLDSDLRSTVPVEDLTELSFGRLRIGQLVIDQQFLDLDPDPWHWQARGHPCQNLWNHAVFRSQRQLRSLKISD